MGNKRNRAESESEAETEAAETLRADPEVALVVRLIRAHSGKTIPQVLHDHALPALREALGAYEKKARG